MVDTLKKMVHDLTNLQQAILGYLELRDFAKAMDACRAANKQLNKIKLRLASILDAECHKGSGK